MIYVETESLFPSFTELSIAQHRIEKIAAEKPPKSPETCHIPAALYFIEQLAKMYREQVRFWEALATLSRSQDTNARKRARMRSLARQKSLAPEVIAQLLTQLTPEQMREEAAAAKRVFYGYHNVVRSFDDAEDPTEFLRFASGQHESALQSLQQLKDLKRSMRARTWGDVGTREESQEKIDAQYDTSYVENQVWFWELVTQVLREKVLQQTVEESALG